MGVRSSPGAATGPGVGTVTWIEDEEWRAISEPPNPSLVRSKETRCAVFTF